MARASAAARRQTPIDLLALEPRQHLAAAAPQLLYVAPPGRGISNATFVDVNNDGRKDAVSVGDGVIVVNRQRLLGGFRAAQVSSLPLPALSIDRLEFTDVTPLDVNGDGFTDLLITACLHQPGASRDLPRYFIARNDGVGNFSADILRSTAALQSVLNINSQFFDLNGDGQIEVIDANLRVFSFVGNTLLRTGVADPVFRRGTSRALIDVDADGDTDIFAFATNSTGTRSGVLLRNNRAAGFEREVLFSLDKDVESDQLFIGDVSGDGIDDIVVSVTDAAYPPILPRRASMLALLGNGTSLEFQASPLFSLTFDDAFTRVGWSTDTSGTYYDLYAGFSTLRLDRSVAGDARVDITFTLYVSRGFSGPRYPITESRTEKLALVAGDPIRAGGLPSYVLQPYTPPPAQPPAPDLLRPFEPDGTVARDDADGDGVVDLIVLKGDSGRLGGQRLVYAQLSTRPSTVSVIAYHPLVNGQLQPFPDGSSLRVGDTLSLSLTSFSHPTSAKPSLAFAFLDINDNGVLDAGDSAVGVGKFQSQSRFGHRLAHTFTLTRQAFWGGDAGAAARGIRALFFVPYGSDGIAGLPATWMINLV